MLRPLFIADIVPGPDGHPQRVNGFYRIIAHPSGERLMRCPPDHPAVAAVSLCALHGTFMRGHEAFFRGFEVGPTGQAPWSPTLMRAEREGYATLCAERPCIAIDSGGYPDLMGRLSLASAHNRLMTARWRAVQAWITDPMAGLWRDPAEEIGQGIAEEAACRTAKAVTHAVSSDAAA